MTAQGYDVTAGATFTLAGAPLGRVDEHGFESDGRTGGRATITIAFEDELVTVPVKLLERGSRAATVEA